jgi:Flp pilus assembly protein TadG
MILVWTPDSMRRMAHKLVDEAGAEIAEAALVLPIVFMFVLGIVWFGRAFNIYSTITHAAQQGVLTAARPSCATCGNDFATNTTVNNAIYLVMNASRVDPAQIPVNSNIPVLTQCPDPAPPGGCTTTANITVCRSVILNPTANASQPSQCGAVVSFQYPFQFYLPFTSLNLREVVFTAQAQTRMEN